MQNLFLFAIYLYTTINSLILSFFKFVEMKFIDEEIQPLKNLVRDNIAPC
jgi:hypothetical protein